MSDHEEEQVDNPKATHEHAPTSGTDDAVKRSYPEVERIIRKRERSTEQIPAHPPTGRGV